MTKPIEANLNIQRLLKEAGYYKGEIDGKVGPVSKAAIRLILTRRKPEALNWSETRQKWAAGQIILHYAGWRHIVVDGYWGNQSTGAYDEWHRETYGVAAEIPRIPETHKGKTPAQMATPTQAQCPQVYGATQAVIESKLEMLILPYPMRLDWNLSRTVTRAQLHRDCIPSAHDALVEVYRHYGPERIRALGLDRNAGTYVWRSMRGGSNLSMHAFGAAWDFFAQPNGLNTRCPQAKFCADDYVPWFNIWEAKGWTSLGREIGRDWMHLQRARLS